MAITPWQAGGILNQKQYFEPGERGGYGRKLPIDPYPALLGAGTLAGGILGPLGTAGTAGLQPCPNPAHIRNAAGQCVPKTTSGGGCPHGFLSDGKGNCVPAGTCSDGGQPPCDDEVTGGDLTCAQRGLVPDGMGGCKSHTGEGCIPPLVPDGSGGCKLPGSGCIYGQDKYGNCIDPTGDKDWYDYVAPGMEPWAKATGPEPGGGPEDWRGSAAGFGTDIGSRVGNAVVGPDGRLQFGGLTDAQKAEIAGQNIGTSALAGQTGYYVPQGFDDFGAMSTTGIQLFPNERPAPLSTEDFLAQYSRPSKTVDQGILSPSQEGAAARRIEDVYGMDNILAPAPVKPVVDRGPSVDDFSDFEEQSVKRQVEEAKERSKAQKSAKKKLEKIKESQAADKKKADEKKAQAADKKKADEKKAQADFHAKEAQKAFDREMKKQQDRLKQKQAETVLQTFTGKKKKTYKRPGKGGGR